MLFSEPYHNGPSQHNTSNAPIDYLQVSFGPEGWSMDLGDQDKEVLMMALRFCQLIVDKNFELAHSYLSHSCKAQWSIEKMEESYNVMTQDMSCPVLDPNPMTYMSEWHHMSPENAGWVYIPVTENCIVEAITVVISDHSVLTPAPSFENLTQSDIIRTPKGEVSVKSAPFSAAYKIDEIEFGRP